MTNRTNTIYSTTKTNKSSNIQLTNKRNNLYLHITPIWAYTFYCRWHMH